MNRWKNAAVPALLLHCSIGTVYCWSVFSQEIADYIGFSKSAVEWAFSLAIFFLGMSASFMGSIVERDIKKSSLIATICFTAGMLLTGCFIYYGGLHPGSLISLIGIFISYGMIMGIGLGTGYLSPVKTLMLWFSDAKGLATGLAVAGFGLAKAIASPIMTWMLDNLDGGIYKMFVILGCVYAVMMFIGHILLHKPEGWHEPAKGEKKPGIVETISTRPVINYIGIWLMFYINITCGLALISQEKAILKCIGLVAFTGTVSAVSSLFNALGRIGFSSWADKLKDRNTVFKTIFILSAVCTGITFIMQSVVNGAGNAMLISLALAMIFIVNAGYGGGFSNIPTLLSDHYGMSSISTIHGITLSAWAFAGLTGNQLASFIITHTGEWIEIEGNKVNPLGYQNVVLTVAVLYVVAYIICMTCVNSKDKK